MNFQTSSSKVGYTRYEFGQIFQVYSRNVYAGLFKDFSFTEISGHYFISFREEAGKTPLITVQKHRLGPDRSLFIATTPGPNGHLVEIVRSEKIDIFVQRLRSEVEKLHEFKKTGRPLKIVS